MWCCPYSFVTQDAATFSTLASAFDDIVAVAGSIVFRNTDVAAVDNTTFPRLEAVSGSITFTRNKLLRSVQGFRALVEVGAEVSMEGNSVLEEAAFPALHHVRGTVAVSTSSNPKLARVGLPKLAHAGGVSVLGEFHDRYFVSSLLRLSLPSLRTVVGALVVKYTSKMETLHIPTLASTGTITISAGFNAYNCNCRLRSFEAPSLAAVTGSITIQGSKKQYEPSKYHALRTIRLPKLASVGGSFTMSNINMLEEVFAPALRSVKSNLVVHAHSRLRAIRMPGLASVGGNFELNSNHALLNTTLPNLGLIGGNLQLYQNSAMQNAVMPNLGSVGGSLHLYQNNALQTVTMPRLRSAGSLDVQYCKALRTLGGFGQLTTLTAAPGRTTLYLNGVQVWSYYHRGLDISNNNGLKCIKSLANITRITGTLTLANNLELHICNSLYAKLQSAAQTRVSGFNALSTSFEGREDCSHRC